MLHGNENCCESVSGFGKSEFLHFFALVYISIKYESFFWRGHPTENESFFWGGHPTENESDFLTLSGRDVYVSLAVKIILEN